MASLNAERKRENGNNYIRHPGNAIIAKRWKVRNWSSFGDVEFKVQQTLGNIKLDAHKDHSEIIVIENSTIESPMTLPVSYPSLHIYERRPSDELSTNRLLFRNARVR